MRRWLLLAACATAAWSPAAEGQDSKSAEGLAFFETRIRPVLVEHCYECHSAGGKLQGGLVLDTRAGIRRGGDSGPAVVPSAAADSLLLEALRYESFEMPPTGRLPDEVIADFEKWIRIGAPDPRDGDSVPASKQTSVEAMLEAGRAYWSFQPVQDPAPPDVQDTDWCRNGLDRFVLARMEAAGLKPGSDAEKDTLLRRLSFDLTGLPPTPEELAAFLADDEAGAYERIVDRLLESPRFGERWGRHWLDVVRFSESSGGGRTRIFPEAWRYRDYVIESFQQDKPFDRFITEQIAGDLLPDDSVEAGRANLVATSFLAIGPTNYELQDKELLTMEVVDEQIDTIGKVFLGMTIGCARCHDHKFDPIPTRDYYALAGIFRSTKSLNHANVSDPVMRMLPVEPEQQRALEEHAQRVAPLKQRIAELEKQLKPAAPAVAGRKSVPLKDVVGAERGMVLDDSDPRVRRTGDWTASSSIAGFVGAGYLHSRDPEARLEYPLEVADGAILEARLSWTPASNRASAVVVTVHHADGETARTLDMQSVPPIDGTFASLGRFRFEGEARVSIACVDVDGVVIADAVQFLEVAELKAGSASGAVPSLVGAAAGTGTNAAGSGGPDAEEKKRLEAELAGLRKELKREAADGPPPVPVVMSVEEESTTGDCRICIRGNVHNEGDVVPRGFLSVMTRGRAAEIPDGESGRRQLAAWIASRENTLTARVYVNRVWYWLFGEGLVRTTSNFGTAGERPSHPELLDWLAVRFTEDGWSTRRLIRMIVLSRTYRQSSVPSTAAEETDPHNRWLSHMRRRRLDAESLRDAMLAISGQLDLTPGGSTIRPGASTEFGYVFNDVGLDGRRRSVYVPVFRNSLLDVFEVFDFADPNLPMGRRNVSTLPTQSLYLMNSPWVRQQAHATAERLTMNEALSDTERIELAHVLCFSRYPTPAERELAERYLAAADSPAARGERWTQFVQALFGSLDFRYVR